jgi:GNAT superfamily N-acetyltransferase
MTSVRKTARADAPAILRLAAAEPLFSREDREVVDELLAEYLEESEPGDYRFLTAVEDGRIAGFACYGPTPLTRGTYDLYWICVARGHRRRGTGRALLQAVIRGIRRNRGRLLSVETSGRRDFAPTRAFYERAGLTATARVPGFYAPGDDLVIFTYAVRPSRTRKPSKKPPRKPAHRG